MTPARLKPDIFACSSDQRFANDIQCAPAILEQLSALAAQGFFRLRHGGLEIGGVLYGYRDPGLIRIEAYRELQCEHAFGPAFRLSDSDWDRLGAMLSLPDTDPELEGMTAAGWYVSHTRTGLNLTETDRQVFERYFTDASHVALVLKPDQFLPTRAAWFSATQPEPLAEFSIEIADEAKGTEAAGDAQREAPAQPLLEPGAPPEDGMRSVQIVVEPGRRRTSPLAYAVAAFVASALIAASAGIVWMRFRPVQEAVGQQQARSAASRVISVAPAPREIHLPPVEAEAVVPSAVPETPKAVRQSLERSKQRPNDRSNARVKELEQELAALRAQLERKAAERARSERYAAQRSQLERKPPPPSANVRPAQTTPPPQQAQSAVNAPVLRPLDSASVVRPLDSVEPLRETAPAPPATTSVGSELTRPAVAPQATSGRLIWTGALRKGDVLFIENGRASSGSIIGALPGDPARVVVSGAELAGSGIVVYTRDLQRSGMSENPGPQNGWNYTIYQYDPGRVGDVRVLEAPGAQNGWKKLVVRSERRRVSIIVVDWELLKRPAR